MGQGKSQPIGRGMTTGTSSQAPQGLSGPGRGVGGPGMMNMMPNMGRGMGIPIQGSTMQGTNMQGTTMQGTTMQGTNMQGTQFPQGRGTQVPMQSKLTLKTFRSKASNSNGNEHKYDGRSNDE